MTQKKYITPCTETVSVQQTTVLLAGSSMPVKGGVSQTKAW